MNEIRCLRGLAHVHRDGGRDTSREHWWKLTDGRALWPIRDYLNKCQYAFRKGESFDRLAYLATRAQRSMISYYKRPVAELRSFCKSRGINIPRKIDKDDIVTALEKADEEVRFPRFLELPPELRVLVYEFSFDVSRLQKRDDWRVRPYYLTAPPLASVSWLLRREVFPLFYTGGTLEVDMFEEPDGVYEAVYHYDGFRESRIATDFFAIAPAAALGSVKALEILMHRPRWASPSRPEAVRKFDITLPTATAPYQITQTPETYLPWIKAEQGEKWEKDLGQVLEAMVPQEKGKAYQLQRGDIYPIRKVFQTPLDEKFIL